MSNIETTSINWLKNGEKAEADILNRPIQQLLQQVNIAVSDVDTRASDRLDAVETTLSSKANKPSITTSGTNLDWATKFKSSTFASTPAGDSIKEAEYTLYDKDGSVVRVLSKTTDFYNAQFALTDMQEGTEYTLRVRHLGSHGWSEHSAAFSFKTKTQFEKIYGVALITGGNNGGTLVHIDSAGNPINLKKSDFDAHPVWGGMVDQVVDGQSMVKIPKFYTKTAKMTIAGYSGTKKCWFVSDKPNTGFETAPAFFDAGSEVDQFWYGKYQATVDATKMCSVPGVLPTVSTSLTQFKAAAELRNVGGTDGFMVLSWYQMSALQWLYLVENATFDSQAKTGQGRVSESSAAEVDAVDVAQASYRGIVGLWGNVHQWIDGFIWNPTTGIRVWDNKGNKSWVETGKFYTLPLDSHQYPLTHMEEAGVDFDLSDGFIGETASTNISTSTVPDRTHFGSTDRDNVPIVGGSWSLGSNAGLWFFHVFTAATHSNTHLGSRLAKV